MSYSTLWSSVAYMTYYPMDMDSTFVRTWIKETPWTRRPPLRPSMAALVRLARTTTLITDLPSLVDETKTRPSSRYALMLLSISAVSEV